MAEQPTSGRNEGGDEAAEHHDAAAEWIEDPHTRAERLTAAGETDETAVLAGGPAPSRRRRGLIAGVGALVLALVAVGGVYAYTWLSGGGAQPEKFVPADAIGLVKIDLDPAAGQKVAALRFFRHFPGAAEALQGDDVREIVFRLMQRDNDELAKLDFDTDIAPWLGDRLGVAFLPPASNGEPPQVLGVLQVKDEDKARTGLPALLDGDGPAMVFEGGYALLAEDEATATAARDAAAKANLGDDPQFQEDLEPLGDGVAAFWVDLAAAGDAAGLDAFEQFAADQGGLFGGSLEGRLAGAVTFDANHADLTVRGIGTSGLGTPAADADPVGPWLSTVPADTIAALGLSGLDRVVTDLFTSFLTAIRSVRAVGVAVERTIADFERQSGLRLPEDLATLLGNRTLITIKGDAINSEVPQGVALRTETDAAAAQVVLEKLQVLLRRSEAPIALTWRADGSDVIVGLSEADLADAKSGPGISDPAAKEALPDLESAQQVLWIDLDRAAEIIATQSPSTIDSDVLAVLTHIAGIGMTAATTDEGSTTTLRVVAD